MNLNEYLNSQRNVDEPFHLFKRIECQDGFSLSVQAMDAAYCQPRDNIGPWYTVEVGFPSAKPEFIMDFCENPDKPMETVYGYVPVELVEKLIDFHGGVKKLAEGK